MSPLYLRYDWTVRLKHVRKYGEIGLLLNCQSYLPQSYVVLERALGQRRAALAGNAAVSRDSRLWARGSRHAVEEEGARQSAQGQGELGAAAVSQSRPIGIANAMIAESARDSGSTAR